ncbi:MAG: transposase [Syntrophales bacterium]|nr:transposase [Syntrophales bacterium]
MHAKVAINTREYFPSPHLVALNAFLTIWYFNKIFLDNLTVILYNISMRDATYFTRPIHEWQKRYEALRSSFVDRLPAEAVAERFGYSAGYVRLLRHQFTTGKLDFSEPIPEGASSRYRVTAETRRKIRAWREKELSAGEIAQLLSDEGLDISVRTVERVLAEEGFPKLPRRTRLKIGLTVKGAEVPQKTKGIAIGEMEGRHFSCESAGVFLFAPFLEKFQVPELVHSAGLPGTKVIPAVSYFLSFLALKLIGTERYAHMGDHAFDPGLGLFAGLNVLPKCTAMSVYSYSLDEVHILKLQQAFVKKAAHLGLYDGSIINLDFHTIPHYGEESVLQEHWAGARGKRMKGALTLFAQDASSKLILYTAADIMKEEANEQVMNVLSFWKKIQKGVASTFVFDSKFTTYEHLSLLNSQGVRFITLRRRGKKLVRNLEKLSPWEKIHIPHDKRKYPDPYIHQSLVELKDYEGQLRQIIIRGNGHEEPAFLITNDLTAPAERIVSDYARRWRVENVISEAVKFFNLNALSSPILVKVHFDVLTTMIADTLYSMLAHKLRGFEQCDAQKIYRHFIRGKADVEITGGEVRVTYSRRAHNPILRDVPWQRLPQTISWLDGAKLKLKFQ